MTCVIPILWYSKIAIFSRFCIEKFALGKTVQDDRLIGTFTPLLISSTTKIFNLSYQKEETGFKLQRLVKILKGILTLHTTLSVPVVLCVRLS